jgi:hypothetical protein
MKPTNLLWTGGWDSTYRLLELLLIQNQPVKPYYLVDPGRKSTQQEFMAMDQISMKLKSDYGITSQQLHPLEIVNTELLNNYPELTEKYLSLRERFKIGAQYEWLSKFAHQYNIKDLELGIERGLIDRTAFFKYLEPFIVCKNGHYELLDNVSDKDLILFENFRFPVFFETKISMKEKARYKGFYHILNKSWFCHTPKNGRPCGWCNPCKDIMTNKMNERMPLYGKMRYYLYKVIK